MSDPKPASPATSPAPERSESFEHSEHWANVLLKEFSGESDRAAVIVAAAIFDDCLSSLLKQFLVPNPSSIDELFDGTNAPLATFSAKIAMAHRLGLVSSAFARNLHLIRRIRNELAHDIHGCTFEESGIKNRVLELYKSQKYRTETKSPTAVPKGTRGQFLIVCLWMLWSISSRIQSAQPLSEAQPEFGFLPD
jgi:hypothetical protein